MEELEISGNVVITQPVSYSFRFKPYGWAILTLNESTGEVTLVSDWGNYAHRWHIGHIGEPTLHEFFIKAGADYLVNKFSYENKTDLEDVTDHEATEKGLIEHIDELVSNETIGQGLADELKEDVASWKNNSFDCSVCPSDLEEFLDQPYEHIQTKRSTRYEFLVKRLLPVMKKYLHERQAAQPPELRPV